MVLIIIRFTIRENGGLMITQNDNSPQNTPPNIAPFLVK